LRKEPAMIRPKLMWIVSARTKMKTLVRVPTRAKPLHGAVVGRPDAGQIPR